MEGDLSWAEVFKGVLLVIIAVVNGWLVPMLIKLNKRVETVATECNGMKTELVKTTKELGEQLGYAKGVKEERITKLKGQ